MIARRSIDDGARVVRAVAAHAQGVAFFGGPVSVIELLDPSTCAVLDSQELSPGFPLVLAIASDHLVQTDTRVDINGLPELPVSASCASGRASSSPSR